MLMGVLDSGETMAHCIGDRTESKLSIATKFFASFVLRRMLASTTFEAGFVTYGDSRTDNLLNKREPAEVDEDGNITSPGGYPNVVEVVPMGKACAATLQDVVNIEPSGLRGDLIDGIVVGQEILDRVNHGKAFNRIMVLMTDGETPVEGIDDLDQIVEGMKNLQNFGIYILVLGEVTSASSVVKQENAKLLRSLAQDAGGVYGEIENTWEGEALLAGGSGLNTKPQLAKIALKLSPTFSIPCQHWNIISEATAPSLKKKVVGSDGVEANVKRDTLYLNPEDPAKQLLELEKVKGYRYGMEYVPVTDKIAFKIEQTAGITIIGSIPLSGIPKAHCMEGPYVLQGAVDSDPAISIIEAINASLRATGRALLARYVKRDGSEAQLVYLAASGKPAEGHLMLMQRLPTSDDVRKYEFPALSAMADGRVVQATPQLLQQQQAMSSFVDQLTITDEAELASLLTPPSPLLHNVFSQLCDKITGSSIGISANSSIPDTIVAPYDRLRAASSSLQTVLQVFPLQRLEAKRKSHWTEMLIKSGEGGEGGAKRMKVEGVVEAKSEEEVALESLPEFTNVSAAPLEDFEAFMAALDGVGVLHDAQKSRLAGVAFDTLRQCILGQITIGCSKPQYRRAVAGIGAMRAQALTHSQVHSFNAFMTDQIKAFQTGRHRAMWDMLLTEL
ncbi:SPOC like C-terminal domain-containing protein, partial [Ochromonadaceae sp. CCMP2298]